MTQKIKERLEQAAETAWEQVQNERLEYLESDNAGLRERVKELEAQLTKYRVALERIITPVHGEYPNIENVNWIAKEALKQQ